LRNDLIFNRKLSPIAFILLISLLLIPCILGFFFTVTSLENREQQKSIENRSQAQLQKIQSAFLEITSLLQALRSLVELNPQLTQLDFDYFVAAQAISDYGITAFEWIPKIAPEKLPNWTAEVKKSGLFDFDTNYNSSIQDPRIKDIFPIRYSSANQMQGFTLGQNLAQETRFANLLIKAQQSASIQLSVPTSREQTTGLSRFLLATFSPQGFSYTDLHGFVGASFNIEETIGILLGNSLSDLNLCLNVTKIMKNGRVVNLFGSNNPAQSQQCQTDTSALSWHQSSSFAGESLTFSFYNKQSDHFLGNFSATQLASLAFIIATLSCLYYLFHSRRYALKVEHLIDLKQARLEDMTEDYSKLFMLSVDGIYQADLDGKLLKVNPAFAKAFNYLSPNEICAQVADIGTQLHASSHSYKAFIEKLTVDGQIANFEWRGNTQDNQPVWCIENAHLIEEPNKEPYYQGFISIISERKNAEFKLQYQANYDSLTGLRNRASFVESLEQQLSTDRVSGMAIIFIDIDRFKSINDNFGHGVGDELLIQFAKRLKQCFESAQIARFGGDEFALYTQETPNTESLEKLSSNLLDNLKPCFVINESIKLSVTASIGASLLTNHCTNATQALQQADLAMYQVKHSGRNNCAIYDQNLTLLLSRRLKLEHLLNSAFDNHEFELVYQPIMSIENQQIAGFEALIRWHSTELGEVSPSEFIPLMEELNLIAELGEWIILQALSQISTWIVTTANEQLYVNINVSPKQLIQRDIASLIEQQISAHKLGAANLHIEVTETQIYTDEARLMEQLNRIHLLGVGIYIDDFGTGHSSLERLVNYPLKGIKLDRSFVIDLALNSSNAIVLEATVRMAHLLGLQITAEGIEKTYQLNFFKGLDCHYAQGYLFHKPLPVLAIDNLLINISHANNEPKIFNSSLH
jgi:diguanylate cyclase (GGDEF)-like protein/PAS domain S-box-containing protein